MIRCSFKPSMGQRACPSLGSNLPYNRTTIISLKDYHQSILENHTPFQPSMIRTRYSLFAALVGIYIFNGTRPGSVLEFFKYPDPARFCKSATRSTSMQQQPHLSQKKHNCRNCNRNCRHLINHKKNFGLVNVYT